MFPRITKLSFRIFEVFLHVQTTQQQAPLNSSEFIGKIRQYFSNSKIMPLFTQITFNTQYQFVFQTSLHDIVINFPQVRISYVHEFPSRRNIEYKVLAMCSNEKTWRNIPADQYIGSVWDVLRIISENVVFLRLKYIYFTSISLCYFPPLALALKTMYNS